MTIHKIAHDYTPHWSEDPILVLVLLRRCQQKSHNSLNGVYLCAIKVSHDHNINIPVPGKPESLLENKPKQTAS